MDEEMNCESAVAAQATFKVKDFEDDQRAIIRGKLDRQKTKRREKHLKKI